VQDYDSSSQRANTLDSRIHADASLYSTENYYNLVAIGARQTMAIDFTVAPGKDGSPDPSDVKAFMKNTGVAR